MTKRLAVAFVFALLALAGCSSSGPKAAANDGTALVGKVALRAGDCRSGMPSGTNFRMIQPGRHRRRR